MTWLDRRVMMTKSAGLLSGLAFLGHGGQERPGAGSLPFEVMERGVISHVDRYHGWPTLFRRRDGELILVCSGGREAHVCPFGRVELMRSADDGRSWSWPRVLMDSAIDDRDAGGVETATGALLVTTFTSLAYAPSLERHRGETRARWSAAHERLSEEQRKAQLGTWMLRSDDAGVTWSAPRRVPVNSPHGPIQLRSGRLLYAGKELWKPKERVGVCISDDDGHSWKWLAEIPTRPGDRREDYHELHAVEVEPDHVVVHIRNHNKKNDRETLQARSKDGGKTWSVPRATGVWGLPSHLLRLRDGRLLMSYGHRRKPYGVQARLSSDAGRTWGEPMILSGDGVTHDLGYPSTVELADGSMLTVWYEKLAARPRAVLRQARWRLRRP